MKQEKFHNGWHRIERDGCGFATVESLKAMNASLPVEILTADPDLLLWTADNDFWDHVRTVPDYKYWRPIELPNLNEDEDE
jgi:hypothetical protein